MISEREKLEFESLPEFVRDPRPAAKETYNSRPSTIDDIDLDLPKSAELEALWPGVSHHELVHTPNRKGPSFYLTIGFMGGAVVSLIGVWIFSLVVHPTANNVAQDKRIVVAHGGGAPVTAAAGIGTATGSGSGSGAAVVTKVPTGGDPEVIVPLVSTYEVQNGDTLAAIALRNYKRATPRLLDEICRVNNMASANVLSLGQKLILPEYRPIRQIATSGSSQ